MRDMRSEEPKIEINYALLKTHGVDAAMLYGYLKSVVISSDATTLSDLTDQIFDLVFKRKSIQEAIGLSPGQQLDAEHRLLGTGLLISNSDDEQNVEYFLSPGHEDEFTRWVYSRAAVWKHELLPM